MQLIGNDTKLFFSETAISPTVDEASVRAYTWETSCIKNWNVGRTATQVPVSDQCGKFNKPGSKEYTASITVIMDPQDPFYIAALTAFGTDAPLAIWLRNGDAATGTGTAGNAYILSAPTDGPLDAQATLVVGFSFISGQVVDVL